MGHPVVSGTGFSFLMFDTFCWIQVVYVRLMLLAQNNVVTAFANQHDLLFASLIFLGLL